ncbi:MAG: hypothetical protein HLUCCA12_00790 [Rhodobacteraceae bacterium HLUCCA12]|nr:MAG: hypothetical protein HLUCCA12_00790 [Rhodobacteraceae bacterium HLUCCA12]
MTLRAAYLAALVALAPVAPAAAQGTMASSDGVILRGLDKISGETTDLEVSVGESVEFARLEISLIACRFPADDPSADAFAFLDITDARRGEQLFRGWMIASSPALNALDHARYDVWVIGCQ